MACYRMPVGLTRDGSGCGIWNSRNKSFFQSSHELLSIDKAVTRALFVPFTTV